MNKYIIETKKLLNKINEGMNESRNEHGDDTEWFAYEIEIWEEALRDVNEIFRKGDFGDSNQDVGKSVWVEFDADKASNLADFLHNGHTPEIGTYLSSFDMSNDTYSLNLTDIVPEIDENDVSRMSFAFRKELCQTFADTFARNGVDAAVIH